MFSLFLNRWVTAVTFNSEFTKDTMLKSYRLRKTRWYIVHNGTKPRGAEPTFGIDSVDLCERLSGRFVVGTYSRLVACKRIDRLLKAVKEIADPNIAVLIVGDGPRAAPLKELAGTLGLLPQVFFVPAQAHISPFLARMDICVFPGEREAFGLSALEALSAGKPAIVFADGGGIVEMIKPLQPEDVVSTEDELAKRILHYSKNRENDSAVRRRQTHAAAYAIEAIARKFMDVYASAAKIRPQASQ
jgi:glycosyltransferase involved in cell wall biosynthesis